MDSARLRTLQRSLPFFDWYATSPHRTMESHEGIVDLLFGNPHDMPDPAYVAALRHHTLPEDPGWFGYVFNNPEAVAVAAQGLRDHTGMSWHDDDIAMTNGGWGAIAVAIRLVTEPGDEVIYYDPPWFF